MDTLLDHSINGFQGMPPLGLCMQCTEADFRALIEFMAATYPDINIIGCEPFINGVAMLLGKIRAAGVTNVSVHPGDARDLMDVLPDASISRAFLNYPDPWPKARHHRRRFVTPEHLLPLARVMKAGAEFRVVSDIPDYIRQTLEEVPPAGFDLVAEGPEIMVIAAVGSTRASASGNSSTSGT